MRLRLVIVIVAGAASAWWMPLAVADAAGAAVAPAGPVSAAGSRHKAIEVPGLGTLNAGGFASVNLVSCGAAGDCAAGGTYAAGAGHTQVFVVAEKNGRWGKAIEVPGSGALNKGGLAAVYALSCPSAGSCAVGGVYTDGSNHSQAFVDTERSGRWRRAIEVPGSGALNKGGNAAVNSVSCATAGNCAAAGYYVDGAGHGQAFVVTRRTAGWGKAIEVPGSKVLNKGGNAGLRSVSCATVGNCAAGGSYRDGSGHDQALVASEKNGRWGKAIEVPGSGALNKGGNALVLSVSCPSAGNCAAGANYTDGSGHAQVFVVAEKNGRWGKAIEVPGLGTLNRGGDAVVRSVSCGAAGNCAAAGFYTDRSAHSQAYVVAEKNGRWGKAIEVPGLAMLNRGGDAGVRSVSCASPGNCTAAGHYTDRSGHGQAFVVAERNGRWGKAIEVPGSAALNAGGFAAVNSVSCRSPGNCAAGGSYRDGSGHDQGFVVSQT